MINIEYKVIFLLLSVLLFLFSGFTNKHAIDADSEVGFIAHSSMNYSSNEVSMPPCTLDAEFQEIGRDCTVRIKTDDMDIELTLHDVSRWDCFKLKVRALWAQITGKL